MSGVDYIVNEKGKRTAVVIDLNRHGKLWEDFQDALVAKQRNQEPRESLSMVKKRLMKLGKIR